MHQVTSPPYFLDPCPPQNKSNHDEHTSNGKEIRNGAVGFLKMQSARYNVRRWNARCSEYAQAGAAAEEGASALLERRLEWQGRLNIGAAAKSQQNSCPDRPQSKTFLAVAFCCLLWGSTCVPAQPRSFLIQSCLCGKAYFLHIWPGRIHTPTQTQQLRLLLLNTTGPHGVACCIRKTRERQKISKSRHCLWRIGRVRVCVHLYEAATLSIK